LSCIWQEDEDDADDDGADIAAEAKDSTDAKGKVPADEKLTEDIKDASAEE
jgi:hypothetical protein